MTSPGGSVDVLVVGAGPTGLTLATQLVGFGVSVRVVDGKAGPVAESRALALQPRTLEVLRGTVTERLVDRGNKAVRLRWHAGNRTAELPLFDMGMDDTAYPFLLFLSQAETEAALVDSLQERGVDVDWNTRFIRYTESDHPDAVLCQLIDADGRETRLGARYLVGCDGAHSSVRQAAGIAFSGGRYPQTFLLADLDADGVEPDAAHVWFGADGPVFFFPLVRPVAWRLLTARPTKPSTQDAEGSVAAAENEDTDPVDLAELQGVVDAATGRSVRLDRPVWSTAFKIHHRQAETYRAGRVLVAGDAAHIHSPAGAQGMNTGIQDAVNLGWKLALVCRGRAPEALLDTYDSERRPVGAFVLRFTDRAFRAATSTSPAFRFARTHLAPRALAAAARVPRLRAVAFHTVAQLGIRYPDTLQAGAFTKRDTHAPGARCGARLGRAVRSPHPRPGERLPDVQVDVDGRVRWLHAFVAGSAFHLLLCGPATGWDEAELADLTGRYARLLRVRRLTSLHSGEAGVLVDVDGSAFKRLGVRGAAHILVRPDGHVAYRDQGTGLRGLADFLATWLNDL